MNKRKAHHIHVKLKPIKSIYLFVLIIFMFGLSVYSLRQNNLNALNLRDNVYAVDKADGDIEKALKELREYIYSHMNTNLAAGANAIKPSIQLKYRYERLVAAEKARVSSVNEKIYAEAQAVCEKMYPSGPSKANRVPCTQEYVSTHGSKEQPIDDSYYKFEFLSPFWTPDLAGFSILILLILSLVFIVKVSLNHWLKQQLHDHL